MFISRKTYPNKLTRTYYFPYRIGVVQSNEKLFRRWRPQEVTTLTGDIVDEEDDFAVAAKLNRLTETKLPIDWIDIAHTSPDRMDVMLTALDKKRPPLLDLLNDPSVELTNWEIFEQHLSWCFCLRVSD